MTPETLWLAVFTKAEAIDRALMMQVLAPPLWSNFRIEWNRFGSQGRDWLVVGNKQMWGPGSPPRPGKETRAYIIEFSAQVHHAWRAILMY